MRTDAELARLRFTTTLTGGWWLTFAVQVGRLARDANGFSGRPQRIGEQWEQIIGPSYRHPGDAYSQPE